LGSVVNYLVLTTLAVRSKTPSNGTTENQLGKANRNDDRSKRLVVAMIGTPTYFAFLDQPRIKSKPSH
jgi:hypothetical protein